MWWSKKEPERANLTPILEKLLDLRAEMQLFQKKQDIFETDLADMRGRMNKRLGQMIKSEAQDVKNEQPPQDLTTLIPKFI